MITSARPREPAMIARALAEVVATKKDLSIPSTRAAAERTAIRHLARRRTCARRARERRRS